MIETDSGPTRVRSRLSVRENAPRRTTSNLADVARQVLESLDASARASGVRLRLLVGADEAVVTIACDPERARQVIGDLVSHAIGHTAAGGEIRLSVNYHAGPFGDRRALVSVSYGASATLSESQRTAVAMGGSIVAGAEVGTGNVFTLVLPAS